MANATKQDWWVKASARHGFSPSLIPSLQNKAAGDVAYPYLEAVEVIKRLIEDLDGRG